MNSAQKGQGRPGSALPGSTPPASPAELNSPRLAGVRAVEYNMDKKQGECGTCCQRVLRAPPNPQVVENKAAEALSPVRGNEGTLTERSVGWWARKRTSVEKLGKSNKVYVSFIALSRPWCPRDKYTVEV